MRGIQIPDRTDDFTADPVELFFDLAYVFAFSQLVGFLVEHPTWAGVGKVALLFGLLWLPWSQFTWSANAVAGNSRPVRLLFLVATAASVPMAAAVTTAYGDGSTVFAVSLSVILVIGLATMGLGLERGSTEYRSLAFYSIPNALTIAILLGGSFLDHGAQVTVWIVAFAVALEGTILAGRGDWIVRTGHFAERHGLIIIVALGEVIVAIGAPVVLGLESGTGLPGDTVTALAASGVFAGLLWWGYFDRPQRAIEYRAEQLDGRARGRFARDVYTYAHAPLVAGIILAAAALEEITLHPSDALPTEFRLMLVGGLALTAVGVAAAIGRSFAVLARERIAAAVLFAVVIGAASTWNGVVLLVVVDVILLATLAVEHARVERPRERPAR